MSSAIQSFDIIITNNYGVFLTWPGLIALGLTPVCLESSFLNS